MVECGVERLKVGWVPGFEKANHEFLLTTGQPRAIRQLELALYLPITITPRMPVPTPPYPFRMAHLRSTHAVK